MYLKTTSPQFLPYGFTSDEKTQFKTTRNVYEYTEVSTLRKYDHKVSFELLEGIAILVIRDDNGSDKEFVIHRRAIINEGTLFTIIPLTLSALVEEAIETNDDYEEVQVEIPNIIQHKPIRPQFNITDIFSYYYSVKGQNYSFKGESHLYWEITYIDTGDLTIDLDGKEFNLSSQDMMIYLPGQFHKQQIKSSKSCSYLTIMFDMNIGPDDAEVLRNKVIHCNQAMYTLIGNIVKQSSLLENYDIAFSKDLMISYLHELIIFMIQSTTEISSLPVSATNPVQQKFEGEMIDEISNYIMREIYNPISVEDICDHFGISRSTLQTLFKKHLNVPPKQYINDMKMKKAQQIITQEQVPITEVALRLGFSSIHYFSRKFKKEFGISPTEFAQSIFKTE